MKKLAPISEGERLDVIDVIRGFAILGIFLVNMQDFNSPWLYMEPGVLWGSKKDLFASSFIDIFAQASFYTLFSFLFGYGIIIFKERAIKKEYRFVPLFSRRLFFLLILGIIHAFLIWHGDILITYAIIGFIFLLFHNLKAKTLLIWAIVIILISAILVGGLLFIADLLTPTPISNYNPEKVELSLDVYSSGTYLEITKQRVNDWLYVNNFGNYIFIILGILPMFLLGAYAAKERLFHNVKEHYNKIKSIWTISLIIAVVFKFLPYIVEDNIGIDYLQDTLGGPAAALFYATSIALLFENAWWRKKIEFFKYIGRLSLSNYLFQSIVSTTIFYGYGFGFYGSVSTFYGLLLTITIFIIQILLSKAWIKKYRIGPVEWLWRSFTYKKIQPIKK